MITSLFFVTRMTAAWLAMYILFSISVHELLFRHQDGGALVVVGGFLLTAFTITNAF